MNDSVVMASSGLRLACLSSAASIANVLPVPGRTVQDANSAVGDEVVHDTGGELERASGKYRGSGQASEVARHHAPYCSALVR